MKLSDIRDLRGMDDEEARAYLHKLVDFIVDESCVYLVEHGNVGSTTIDGHTNAYYGVILNAVFYEETVFDNKKGWISK